jgi:hypothetical protein
MTTQRPEFELFTYKRYVALIGYTLICLIDLLCAGMTIGLSDRLLKGIASSRDFYGASGAILFVLFIAAFINIGFFIVFRQNAAIGIDNEGIKTYYFGRWGKCLKWREIDRIRRVYEYDPSSYRFVTRYFVHTRESAPHEYFMARMLANSQSPRGAILFDGYLVNLRRLLDRINEYARQYNVPLEATDKQNGGTKAPTVRIAAL